jgi:hypothetical protein
MLVLPTVVSQKQHKHKDVSIAGATKLPWLPVSSINNIQWMFDAISDVIIRISRQRSAEELVDMEQVRIIIIGRNNSPPLVRAVAVVVTTVDVVEMATITTITIRTIDGTIAAVALESPVHQVVVPRTINQAVDGKDSTIRVVVIAVAAEVRIDRVVVMIRTIRTAVHVTTVNSHLTDATTTTTTTTIPTVMDQDDDEVPRPTLTIGGNHK